MKKDGFVVARNRARNQFFTASSAYDRPVWMPIAEATVYLTADMAQRAAVKLATNGQYEARVVTVAEAMELSMPAVRPEDDVTNPSGLDVEVQPDGEGGLEMTAQEQEPACDVCSHSPCTCDDTSDGVDDIVDQEVTGQMHGDGSLDDQGDEMSGLDPMRPRMESADVYDLIRKTRDYVHAMKDRTGTNAIKIAKFNAAAEHWSDTSDEGERVKREPALRRAAKVLMQEGIDPKSTVIKYKDSASSQEETDDEKLTKSGADEHDSKVPMPADVKSDLDAAIKTFNDDADTFANRDDAKSSFSMTVADALDELRDLLAIGTAESMKRAQIHLGTLMNPITMHMPGSVLKFLHYAGRKPTLKDLFDKKKVEARQLSEANDRLEDERKKKLAQHRRDRAELLLRIRGARQEGDDAQVDKIKKSLAVTDGAIKNLSK